MDADYLMNRLAGSDDGGFQGNRILGFDEESFSSLDAELSDGLFLPASDDENDILGLEQQEKTVDVPKYRDLYNKGHINFAEFERLKRKKSGRKKTGPKSWTKYADNPQNRAINRVGYTKRAACDWPLLEPPQNEDTDSEENKSDG